MKHAFPFIRLYLKKTIMKSGDKVVCINDENLYHIPVRNICAGIIYTISDVFTCKCGNVYVRLAEVNKVFNMWCPKCKTYEDTIMYFHIERFRPLDEEKHTNVNVIQKEVPVIN